MVTKTVAIYVFFDDLLKTMKYKEPKTRQTTDAEIATTLLIAAQYFGGNIEKAISFGNPPIGFFDPFRRLGNPSTNS